MSSFPNTRLLAQPAGGVYHKKKYQSTAMALEEFGKLLGVTRKTILNWETKGNIPQSALERMADLFNVSVDYLLAA